MMQPKVRQGIVKVLTDSPPLNNKTIAARLNAQGGSVRRATARLVAEGVLAVHHVEKQTNLKYYILTGKALKPQPPRILAPKGDMKKDQGHLRSIHRKSCLFNEVPPNTFPWGYT